MAEFNRNPDTEARTRTASAQAVMDHAIGQVDEETSLVADSSQGIWQNSGFSTARVSVAVVLGLWLAVVVLLGARGGFVSSPGIPPIPIAVGVTAPIIVFLAAYWLSPSFRRFATNADILLVAALQGWRWAGFGFISLYVYGVLPGRFAWPAGLGDMAIGLTAPFIVLALARRPGFAGSRLFVISNLLGILDLVLAVSNAALIQSNATGAAGKLTVAPMALLPLLLIPAYLVPLFIMLHLTALIKARRAARTERGIETGAIASPNALRIGG